MGGDQEGGFKTAGGGHGANIMQDGTVDFQHETRVYGNFHPYIKGYL
jgi:hypothetical protein